jgi:hypothetical protein
MPRNAKGPRLWPEGRRRDGSGKNRHPCWVIRDGPIKRSTGVRVESRKKPPPEAEQRLANYIASKHKPSRESSRSAASILIADVLSIYAEDKAQKQARPEELGMRITALLRVASLLPTWPAAAAAPTPTRARRPVRPDVSSKIFGRRSTTIARRDSAAKLWR